MERKTLFLAVAAIPLGLAGGYAWSAMTAVEQRARPPKATIAEIPPSPEELPEVADAEWTNRADDNQVATAETGCVESGDDGFDCAPSR
jgi:hypothetical protein